MFSWACKGESAGIKDHNRSVDIQVNLTYMLSQYYAERLSSSYLERHFIKVLVGVVSKLYSFMQKGYHG